MSWQNPFEKREVKKPDTAEGESNVVDFVAPAVIARDALANPIGTAPDTITAEAVQRLQAEEEHQQAA